MSFSFSDLLRHQRCPKSFEYSVVRNLQKKRRNVNMTKGSYVHDLLMTFYLDGAEEMHDRYLHLCEETFAITLDDEVLAADDLLDEAYDLVQRYLRRYQDEWEILHVEATFEVEINGEVLTFTPDLIIRDDRGVWCVDHKTTSRKPGGTVGVGDFQAMLYSSMLAEIYPDFRGFIFNRMRKKLPSEPRLTKTGEKRVAYLATIDTTYEILRDFLREEAPELLNDEAHQRRLAELRDEDTFFYREYVFTTEEMAEEMVQDVAIQIDTIHFQEDAGRFPRSFLPYAGAQECSNCPFMDLCVTELRGYNVESVLEFYEPRDLSHKEYDYELEDL